MSTIVQSQAGSGAVSLPEPATAGSLLVVMQAHREDPQGPQSPASGFSLAVVEQFATSGANRRGVALWYKFADGGEQSFDLGFGGGSGDLPGIVVEFSGPINYLSADSSGSGEDVPTELPIPVPPEPGATLVVAGAVSRGSEGLNTWSDEFSPLPTGSQTGFAWRENASTVTDNEVVVTNVGGDQMSGASAVFAFPGFTVSGTVAAGGQPVENATIVALDAPTSDPAAVKLLTVASSAPDGSWSVEVPTQRQAHLFAFHDDGADLYTSEGRPFIEEPE